MYSSGGGAGGGTVGIFIGVVAFGIPSSRRGCRVDPGIPESISTWKFHFVPRASIDPSRLHCSPGGFLRTDLHSGNTCFVSSRCSFGWCISSQSGTTFRPVRQFDCTHFVIGNQSKCTKVIHMEFQTNIGMGFSRRVALCILKEQIQRNQLQMEWQVKLPKLYASVRLNLCLEALCESLCVSVHWFDKSVALMTSFFGENRNSVCVFR